MSKETSGGAAGVAAAYDTVAGEYDRHLTRDLWNRRVLWRHFRRLFRPGDHVLDAGCGTGIDALYLASRGVRVTAVDVSPNMLDQLRGKLSSTPFSSLVDVRCADLGALAPTLPVALDGIVSSFAALNTVDLAQFGVTAARLLRPGGHLLCHMLSPGYLSNGIRGTLLGRHRVKPPAHGEMEIKVNGRPLQHLMLTPDQVYARYFSAGFSLRRSHALGFLVVPAAETLFPQPLLDALGAVESVLGALPGFRSLGRFFVLDLERRRS